MEMQRSIAQFSQPKSTQLVAVDDEVIERELLHRALGHPFLLRIPTIVPLLIIAFAATETTAESFLWLLVGLQALATVFTSATAHNVKRAIQKQTSTRNPIFVWLTCEAISGIIWGMMMIPVAQAGATGAAYTVIYVTITVTLTTAAIAAANAKGLPQALLLGFMFIAAPATYYNYSAAGWFGALPMTFFPPTLLLVGAMVKRQARAGLKAEMENESLSAQLAEALQVSQYLSRRDNLTGLLNRSEFKRVAQDLRMKRLGAGVALIAVDLDHFKLINDEHGHAVGDQALVAAAQIMKSQVRLQNVADGYDEVIARWGGEEFVIALAGCSAKDAMCVAERIRSAFETHRDQEWPEGLKIGASFGVASWSTGCTFDDALAQADKAMYQAKADGRNVVRLASSSGTNPIGEGPIGAGPMWKGDAQTPQTSHPAVLPAPV